MRLRLSWLAPVAAAVLFTFALLNPHSGSTLSGPASSNAMMAMILSNRSASAFLPVSYSMDQNRLPRETFEWTISGASTSSISPLTSSGGTH